MNDIGQVVRGSGTCATFNPIELYSLLPLHALLREKGRTTDLGNLGGKTGQAGGNIAYNVNNRGQVIGVLDLSGGKAVLRWIEDINGRLGCPGAKGSEAPHALVPPQGGCDRFNQ